MDRIMQRNPADRPRSVEDIRSDFPILDRTVNGKPLAYLDNAATSQKPRLVLDAIRVYYEHGNANVHAPFTLSGGSHGRLRGRRAARSSVS